MRISLKPDNAEFMRQISGVRAHLATMHTCGGREGVAARMITVAYAPYLTALRVELRDEVVPYDAVESAA
jgi:hypothetical protein